MHTATFDVNSYRLFCEFFMTRSFLHNGCTFNRKVTVRKGVLTILTVVTLKWSNESTYDIRMIFIHL